MRDPQRKYLIEVAPAMALIAAWIVANALDDGTRHALLGVLPLVAMAWVVVAMLRRLLRKDELEQRIELVSIAFSAATVGLGSFAWSLCASGGVLPRGDLSMVLPALIGCYGITKSVMRCRYR
jgi:hypothetical protein